MRSSHGSGQGGHPLVVAGWGEPVGVAVGDHDVGVVHEAVDHGGSDGEWWEQLPQPAGRCLNEFYEADYLSAEAQQAAICVVDDQYFGGSGPSSDVERNLLPELFFTATWATWDADSRSVNCALVADGGFGAAEDLSGAIASSWQSQINSAGGSFQLDDDALVLDVLDTCKELY